MNMTPHATKRCNDRAIPKVVVDLILDFGAVEFHRGREKLWLDKRGLRQAKRYLGKPHQSYSSLLKECYVVTDGGKLITVARQDRHHKRERK